MIYKEEQGLFDIFAPEKFYVGIDTDRFNYYTAEQQESNWCWAACLQMVSNFHGLNINQREFAYSNCGIDSNGRIKNCPADIEEITTHLNVCTPKLCIRGDVNRGNPHITKLYPLLKENTPIILAYNTGNTIGHAVVLTGMSWEKPLLSDFELKSIIVRDPWPSHHNKVNAGRVEHLNPFNFLSKVYAWWAPTSYRRPMNRLRVIG